MYVFNVARDIAWFVSPLSNISEGDIGLKRQNGDH